MVHPSFRLNFCNRDTRAPLEPRQHRWLVEKRTILGHWWYFGSSLCCFPRPLKSASRYRHQLHRHFKGIWWGRWVGDFAELYVFKWTSLLIPPTTVLIVNLVGIVAGVSYAINSGYQSWGHFSASCSLPFGLLFTCIRSSRDCWGGKIAPPPLLLSSLYYLLPYSPSFGWGLIRSPWTPQDPLREVNVGSIARSFEDHL